MTNEIWKEVNLFGKVYCVSNTGFVKNKHNKFLKPYLSSGGYPYIMVRENNKNHHIRVHRIVANAFIPNPENLPQVNHIDGNKLNNDVSNLEWTSCKKNIQHGFANGLYKRKGYTPSKINQYDLAGNLIKTWSKMKEAELKYNVSHTSLRFCCIGRMKTCAGYIWKYAEK